MSRSMNKVFTFFVLAVVDRDGNEWATVVNDMAEVVKVTGLTADFEGPAYGLEEWARHQLFSLYALGRMDEFRLRQLTGRV